MVFLKHTCHCGMKHNSVLRIDPTRSGLIVKRWHREIKRRFDLLKKLIWQSIVEHDALGLAEPLKTLDGTTEGAIKGWETRRHGGMVMPAETSKEMKEELEAKVNAYRESEPDDISFTWQDAFLDVLNVVDSPDSGISGLKKEAQDMAAKFGIYKAYTKEGLNSFTQIGGRKYDFKRGDKYYVFDQEGHDKFAGIVQTSNPVPIKVKSLEALPHKAFQFSRDPDKVKGFMDWLQDQVDKEILEVSYSKTGRKIAGDAEWQKLYIDSAYKKGLADSATKTAIAAREKVDRFGRKPTTMPASERSVDSAFLAPVHADAMGMIYQRAFQDLRNVTEAMDTGISRSLSLGMAEGRSPMDIARDMIEDVEGIGINRARMIARTEVVWAYNEAALNTYEEAGLEGVKVEVEWSTAFHNVCPDCADLQGRVFTLDEAREVHPPLHPNCRCALIPAGVGEAEGTRGKYDEKTIGEQYKDEDGEVELAGIFADKADFKKPPRKVR